MKIKTLLAIFYFNGLKDIVLVIVVMAMALINIKKGGRYVEKSFFYLNFYLVCFVVFSSMLSIGYIAFNFEYNISY